MKTSSTNRAALQLPVFGHLFAQLQMMSLIQCGPREPYNGFLIGLLWKLFLQTVSLLEPERKFMMFSVSVEVSGVTRSETQHYSSAEWGTIDVSLWVYSEHASGVDKDRTIQPENTLSGQRRDVWAGMYTATESEHQVDCWQELLRLYCTLITVTPYQHSALTMQLPLLNAWLYNILHEKWTYEWKTKRERESQEGQKMNEDGKLMLSEEGVKGTVHLKIITLR